MSMLSAKLDPSGLRLEYPGKFWNILQSLGPFVEKRQSYDGLITNNGISYPGVFLLWPSAYTGLILGLHPANERRRYFVTTSLIGWAQA